MYEDPLDLFAATNAPSRAGVMSGALRGAPRKQSTSISQNVGASQPSSDDYLTRNRAEQQRLMGELQKTYAEPDLGSLQEEAGRRRGSAQSQLLLALAAQQAGQEFAPMQAHFLKQSAASRDPLKFSGGFINETGQVVRDPMFQQEQRRKALETQYGQATEQERKYLEAQQRGEIAAEARASREAMLQATLAQRGDLARAAAATRGDAAADRRAGNQDRVGARVYDDFMKNTKNEQIIVNAHNNLQATAQRTDAASDISFIFQYMKMLDPNSVVRESEFATAQNAAGVPDRIRNLYNRAMHGNRLTPEQRAEFLGTAAKLSEAAEVRIGQVRSDLARQLDTVGADPAVYLPGYSRPAAPAAAIPEGAVRPRGAPVQPAAPVAAPSDMPPPGSVRPRGAR